jgi:hypothetical protein
MWAALIDLAAVGRAADMVAEAVRTPVVAFAAQVAQAAVGRVVLRPVVVQADTLEVVQVDSDTCHYLSTNNNRGK